MRKKFTNVTVNGNIYIVEEYRILGTTITEFEVWERDRPDNPHWQRTHIDGERYGTVLSRRLPAAIAALPYGRTRELAADAHRVMCASIARQAKEAARRR